MKKWISGVIFFIACFVPFSFAYAGTILYVPIDDRPVSLDYTVDTAQAAGLTILTPPAEYLASRAHQGDPEKLWQWVFDHCQQADALVLSTDSLIYGGLVDSRVHHLDLSILQERLERFKTIKERSFGAQLYVFSTIMRSPRMSAGGVEPDYYEEYGPRIFELTALQDKAERNSLSAQERQSLQKDEAEIPQEYLTDWFERRNKNLDINRQIITMAKTGVFDYVIMGRDDTAVYSQSQHEWRILQKDGAELPASIFGAFPGTDQLGMVLLARAYNNLTGQLPFVRIDYAPGTGGTTIPSYEDQPIAGTIRDHVVAAGGIVLLNPKVPDLILAVNTPMDGITHEANEMKNQVLDNVSSRMQTAQIQSDLIQGRQVAVADIAFANGADNALMNSLAKQQLLDKISAYSGWNTASNTVGYAVAQGMMAGSMTEKGRQQLLAVRYLDDWAYQANIRSQLQQKLYELGGNSQFLDNSQAVMVREAEEREQLFTKQYLWMDPKKVKISFPWNRLFEIKINLVS
ncbi:hypothetical protein Ga0466249_003962 [Sporomusaceae bacterium BoRhaA]|uniref:DUF4127 family protein n=1 Tax=Pelorhabdus rhamnosifermentans TaxID=2772457 RepID=UPI001C05F3E6|nr:DUF4127 family protein [Pelorhabdus rhamnosifermentans]MBU2702827.1 hypothetical protein [Pelorhabdus rhamnosifermentans]